MLTLGSLFDGMAGFPLAFAQAGVVTRWVVELEEDCRRVSARHFPEAAAFADVRELTALPGIDQGNGCVFDRLEVDGSDLANMGEAVAVRAEDDAVVKSMGTAERLGADVVDIAGAFVPTATHTGVGVQAFHRLHPTALVGVDGALGDDIADALVPGGATIEGVCANKGALRQLRRAGHTGLVPSSETARAILPVSSGDHGAAAASASDHSHTPKYSTSSPKYLPPVDIITAGFPCQDVSVAGARAGLAGARSGLFHEIIRIVTEMREATDGRYPQYVVLENVPGLTSSNRGWDFAVVLDQLAECGALDIAWRILDAQWFGVAQRRHRVFVVASFRNGASAAEILFEREGGSGHPPSRREARQDAARGAAGGAAFGGNNTSGPLNVACGLTTSGGKRGDFETETFVAERLPDVAHALRAQAQLAHRADVDTLMPTTMGGRGVMAVRRLTPL